MTEIYFWRPDTWMNKHFISDLSIEVIWIEFDPIKRVLEYT